MTTLQEKLLHKMSFDTNETQVFGINTRGRAATQDSLYLEGHPTRID